MKKCMFVLLLVATLVGLLAGGTLASTPGVYLDDQFDGTALNTTNWNDVSSGGGSAVVAGGVLTLTPAGYGNAGAVMSDVSVHPDAGQTVTLSANITMNDAWDWEKIWGLNTMMWVNGPGIWMQKVWADDGSRAWHLYMSDGTHASQSYFVPYSPVGGLTAWWYLVGPTKLMWSKDRVIWELYDPYASSYYTVFDSSTMGPLEGGSWYIPTQDLNIVANTWVNSMQMKFDSMKLEVTGVPEPGTMISLLAGLPILIGFATRRKKA